jgi:Predicted endonuclease distantly related to archaeal Holliday junction resolvase
VRWYRLRGWKILGENVWAAGNELDLIVRRGRTLRFVEVKEKRGSRFGDPLEMVTVEKQRRCVGRRSPGSAPGRSSRGSPSAST